MERSVSAAEANRKFSKLLKMVRDGHSYIVTSHGKAVAKLVPLQKSDSVTRRARAALVDRLRSERVVNAGRWTRDELYEEQP